MTNEEIIQLVNKSLLQTTTGGIVPAQAAREFVQMMIDETPTFQHMRVEDDIRDRFTIDGIEFGDYIISEGQEGQSPGEDDIHTPDIPRLTLVPKEVVAAVDISFDWMRKNIREENAEEDINRILSLAMGRDIVSLIFNGDSSLDTSTRRNRALRVFDGILKQSDEDADTHDVVIPSDPTWTDEFGNLLKALPKQYRDQRSMLRHFVNVDTLDDYENEIGARETAAADAVLFGESEVRSHRRVRIIPVYDMPDKTTVTAPTGNIAVGFGREMELYREMDTRARKLKLTLVTDVDAGYVFSDALVHGAEDTA